MALVIPSQPTPSELSHILLMMADLQLDLESPRRYTFGCVRENVYRETLLKRTDPSWMWLSSPVGWDLRMNQRDERRKGVGYQCSPLGALTVNVRGLAASYSCCHGSHTRMEYNLKLSSSINPLSFRRFGGPFVTTMRKVTNTLQFCLLRSPSLLLS